MLSKYEVAPGLYVGSELGDLGRELSTEMRNFLGGDKDALKRVHSISKKRTELLKAKKINI
tara:strand:- start:496 stop:678 length:183 start_codon:yes stop_codon:yes gene_type:complete